MQLKDLSIPKGNHKQGSLVFKGYRISKAFKTRQKWLAIISDSNPDIILKATILDGMINDDIKLSKAYKTYLDYATGKVPPKKARKFKKSASPKLKTVIVSPKEPTQMEVLDEHADKTKDTSKGTAMKPGVLDVSKDDFTKNNNDDEDGDDDDGGNDDSGNEDDYEENPLFTLADYEEEE
nr:hypothetical protein [Tanacetum cinerariifolium]